MSKSPAYSWKMLRTDPIIATGQLFFKRRLLHALLRFIRATKELDFGPEPDTISLLMRWGYKVEETQVEMRERIAGESYLNFNKSVAYMLPMSISILLVQWFRRKK